MSYPYQAETLEKAGRHYLVEWFYDEDMGPPWEEHDGHGIVSGWERRDKRAGELILVEDRYDKRFYDFQATLQKARMEGWGIRNPAPGMSRKQIIAEAVRRDFERLRGWCNDEWHWCGIVVTLLDPEADPDDEIKTDKSASLWGIESDSEDYHAEVVQDLISEIKAQESREAFPVSCCGI